MGVIVAEEFKREAQGYDRAVHVVPCVDGYASLVERVRQSILNLLHFVFCATRRDRRDAWRYKGQARVLASNFRILTDVKRPERCALRPQQMRKRYQEQCRTEGAQVHHKME